MNMAMGMRLADGAGNVIGWGPIQISVTNLVVIGVMLLLFGLALVVPFGPRTPGGKPGVKS